MKNIFLLSMFSIIFMSVSFGQTNIHQSVDNEISTFVVTYANGDGYVSQSEHNQDKKRAVEEMKAYIVEELELNPENSNCRQLRPRLSNRPHRNDEGASVTSICTYTYN